MTTRRALAALTATLAAAALAATLAGCNDGDANASTTTTTSTPSTTLTPTAQTEEQKAYTAAEASYRAWVTSYAAGLSHYDSALLNRKAATKRVVDAYVKNFADFAAAKDGSTGKFTQDIKAVTGTKYDPTTLVQLQICAVTNARFYDKNGKDVTRSSPNGPLAPINTQARANQIQFTTPDGGKTWQVNTFTPFDDAGASC